MAMWKVKPIGDGSAFEPRRGVKALQSSTPSPSVGRKVYFFTSWLYWVQVELRWV
jgi:hypothetical protein